LLLSRRKAHIPTMAVARVADARDARIMATSLKRGWLKTLLGAIVIVVDAVVVSPVLSVTVTVTS